MVNSRKNLVLANLSERMFVWTPPKTASHSAATILPKLGFELYTQEGKYLKPSSQEIHNHHCVFCNGHENFSFITTMRNPYTMIVPLFKVPAEREKWTQNNFESFLDRLFYGEELPEMYFPCYNYSVRLPDYIIKVESMFEDYLKLPFVKQTEYYKSGELEKDCSVKQNSSDYTNFDWKSLYNQNIADMVYYNYAQVFELGGYDKNSWK